MSALNVNSPLVVFLNELYDPLGIMQPVVLSHLDIATNGFPGSVTNYTIQECRQKKVFSDGEQLEGTIASENHTVWQITKFWLDQAGAPEPCLGDQITDQRGQGWNIIGFRGFQLERTVWNCYCERIQ